MESPKHKIASYGYDLPPGHKPKNFCRRCGQDFSSERGFTFHRIDSGSNHHCMTKTKLLEAGYVEDVKGYWYSVKERKATNKAFGTG